MWWEPGGGKREFLRAKVCRANGSKILQQPIECSGGPFLLLLHSCGPYTLGLAGPCEKIPANSSHHHHPAPLKLQDCHRYCIRILWWWAGDCEISWRVRLCLSQLPGNTCVSGWGAMSKTADLDKWEKCLLWLEFGRGQVSRRVLLELWIKEHIHCIEAGTTKQRPRWPETGMTVSRVLRGGWSSQRENTWGPGSQPD